LDPFLGSGTTAVACKKLNRRFIGIEKNQEYVKIATQRLKNLSLYPSKKIKVYHQKETQIEFL